MPGIVEKALGNTRAGTKKKGAELCAMYVEVENGGEGVMVREASLRCSRTSSLISGCLHVDGYSGRTGFETAEGRGGLDRMYEGYSRVSLSLLVCIEKADVTQSIRCASNRQHEISPQVTNQNLRSFRQNRSGGRHLPSSRIVHLSRCRLTGSIRRPQAFTDVGAAKVL